MHAFCGMLSGAIPSVDIAAMVSRRSGARVESDVGAAASSSAAAAAGGAPGAEPSLRRHGRSRRRLPMMSQWGFVHPLHARERERGAGASPATASSQRQRQRQRSRRDSRHEGGGASRAVTPTSLRDVAQPASLWCQSVGDEDSSGEPGDEDVCAVCFLPDVTDGNEIVYCDKCDVAVHQGCYGVATIPEGSWECEPCRRGASLCAAMRALRCGAVVQSQSLLCLHACDPARAGVDARHTGCVLCPCQGGALKPLEGSRCVACVSVAVSPHAWLIRGCGCGRSTEFAHVACVIFIPEVSFADVDNLTDVTGTAAVGKRKSLRCAICDLRGYAVRCQSACVGAPLPNASAVLLR
jgi:hypothetical protein